MLVLETYWRKHGEEVLKLLAEWFGKVQPTYSGNANRTDALLLAVRHIGSTIPDWPVQGDATDQHCFCIYIMTEDRFRAVLTSVSGGADADRELEHERLKLETAKKQKSAQEKPGKSGAAADSGCGSGPAAAAAAA